MNYRHVFHAGNFADVVKHAVLALVIDYLKQKPQPFRIVDTHAGLGVYDLSSVEAQKTLEWQDGIGRLLAATLQGQVAEILEPYLQTVRAANGGTRSLRYYPGSPAVARALMRLDDALVVNEAHPEDVEALRDYFFRDKQAKVLALDGWVALKSLLPPKERRGVVLIDPPFEEPGEFRRIAEGLLDATQRFATGTVLIWYPIKDLRAVEKFRREVTGLGIAKLYNVELTVRAVRTETEFSGTGLVILNPPFTLPEKLKVVMPFLARVLQRGAGGGVRLEWLTDEAGKPV